MKLFYREYGQQNAGTPVLLVHGLFGSGTNWHGIARRLEQHFRIVVPDLRNHGRSPHSETMSYPDMADDLVELLDQLGLATAHLVGHSMGGKAGMWLALNQTDRLGHLVVVDIAPVTYQHSFENILVALNSLDLVALKRRDDAERLLGTTLLDLGLRQYLLQNLVKRNGGWQWRVNLPVLKRFMREIVAFPVVTEQTFPGQALFLYGTESDYVRPEYGPQIRRLFPYARLRRVPDAGHWLYAEQPDEFAQLVKSFLNA